VPPEVTRRSAPRSPGGVQQFEVLRCNFAFLGRRVVLAIARRGRRDDGGGTAKSKRTGTPNLSVLTRSASTGHPLTGFGSGALSHGADYKNSVCS